MSIRRQPVRVPGMVAAALCLGLLASCSDRGARREVAAPAAPAATRTAPASADSPGESRTVSIPKVPPGHPRVYVRPDDLPALRARLADPAFAADWRIVRQQADAAPPGQTSGGALCNALLYLVEGDRQRGRRAIDQTLPVLVACRDARVFHQPLHWGACVYDWCYDLLTADQKQAFIREFKRIGGIEQSHYPPSLNCQAVVGHFTEAWLLTGMLPAGVAIYDEDPGMYESAARVFFERFVPVRQYYYPSHAHHQGDHYTTRIIYDLGASWLLRRMGGGDVLPRDQQFIPYHTLYNILPNRRQFMRGDGTGDIASGRRKSIMMLAGSYYADGRLLALADSDLFDNQLSPFHEVFELLLRPDRVRPRSFSDLPLTKYFGPPINDMVARTGWTLGPDSNDAVVLMRLGGTFFGNHQFRDMGTFQVYHRGALAISTGVYNRYGTDHWKAYYHQTLAHNGLLVFDPDEPIDRISLVNTGGQRVPNGGADHPANLEMLRTRGYEVARATAHAFGPDPMVPEYSYLAGDITGAYTDKVSLVTRSMVTLNTGVSPWPAVLVVFDRVVARQGSFRKTWLLHTPQEPTIAGRTTTVLRDQPPYHGKMEVHTLLPEAAEIRKIGGPGRDFWVESVGRNFPAPAVPGADVGVDGWRIEVSPTVRRTDDCFLHVMTVMDASTAAGPKVERFGDDRTLGVLVLDRAVVFSSRQQPRTQVGFTLPPAPGGRAGNGNMKVLVCDLAPGYWRVTCDGRELHVRLPVNAAAGSLYFDGPAGRYDLQRVGQAVPPDMPATFWKGLAAESLRATAQER